MHYNSLWAIEKGKKICETLINYDDLTYFNFMIYFILYSFVTLNSYIHLLLCVTFLLYADEGHFWIIKQEAFR